MCASATIPAMRVPSQRVLPSEATRVTYRALLRLCANGMKPEVLPMVTSATSAIQTAIPEDAQAVRGIIRRCSIEQSSADPLAALRYASDSARALHPPSLPATLPAFVLPSHSLLPGERATFVWFEPRYRLLATQILGLNEVSSHADCRYAHLWGADEGKVGVISSIIDHKLLDDGRIVGSVLAGPRCRVVRTAQVETIEPQDAPLLHVDYRQIMDSASADPKADLEMAQDCFRRFLSICPISTPIPAFANVPPIFCAERLSFWLAMAIVPVAHVQARIHCLTEMCTAARLKLISQLLDRIAQHHITSHRTAAQHSHSTTTCDE